MTLFAMMCCYTRSNIARMLINLSLGAFARLARTPAFRSFTASRSFGSISHSRPTLVAFNRSAINHRPHSTQRTPNRFAASAVPMIFMAQSIHSENYCAVAIISLTSEDPRL